MKPAVALQLNLGSRGCDLPYDLWLIEAAAAAEIVETSWRTAAHELASRTAGLVIKLRSAKDGEWSFHGCFGNVAVHYSWRNGRAHAKAAGPDQPACRAALEELRALFPELKAQGRRVPITIWASSPNGSEAHARRMDLPSWAEIGDNYAPATAAELERLIGLRDPGTAGKLLLWHGSPGTGKTWALRALAYEWRNWCDVHYVSDPEAFLGSEPAYMLEVVLDRQAYNYAGQPDVEVEGKWRLVVLEDAGEMLSVDAKERVGQALGRLLNITDGLLGQGARVMLLITTNEELGRLHPAVQRPGRCAAVVPFEALEANAAQAWLARRGSSGRITRAHTLAELFGIVHGASLPAQTRPIGFGKLSRALAD